MSTEGAGVGVVGVTPLFYISGHGFGHASREVEIIHALARRIPGLRVHLRTSVPPDLLHRTLRVPFDLHEGDVDSGIAQSSSVAHEDEATVRQAVAFYGGYARRIETELAWLRHSPVDVVVGDIPPLAFDVAARLGVPSVAIGNFTWDWIYETHPGMTAAAPWLLPLIRAGYGRATLALQLPFSDGFAVFPRVERLPLVCRVPTRDRDATRRHFGLPLDRRVALLSFGGYGMPSLDLSRLDCLREWTIAATDRSAAPPAQAVPPGSIVVIPEEAFRASGFRYEDLVAAADVVVTKPGYGIIAECMAADTAMLYTSRGDFREYDLLVRELPRYVRSRFISQEDLFAGRWRDALAGLMAQPAPAERLRLDGADEAARAIEAVLRAASR
jgi:L-arabinokinase